MKTEHVRAHRNQPPPSSTFAGLDKCDRQNKPDQMRSGESAVISHEMQFIRPHLLMKRRKMRRDNRSSHTILVSVECRLPPPHPMQRVRFCRSLLSPGGCRTRQRLSQSLWNPSKRQWKCVRAASLVDLGVLPSTWEVE